MGNGRKCADDSLQMWVLFGMERLERWPAGRESGAGGCDRQVPGLHECARSLC